MYQTLCPPEGREIFAPDILIWVDTIEKGNLKIPIRFL